MNTVLTASDATSTARTETTVHPTRRRYRNAGAVLAGVVVTVVSSTAIDAVMHGTGVFPGWGARMADSLFLVALAYRLVCNAAGAYVAARIGTVRSARTLGNVGTFLASIGLVVCIKSDPELGPLWYPIALVVTAIPSTLIGGWLRARQLAQTT